MSIYVFSLLVGYELSGVDIAQGRRSEYFRKMNVPVKYIFTDLPNQTYIDRYMNCGIKANEMLSVHLKLANAEHLDGNYSVNRKIAELKGSMGFDNIISDEKKITLYKNGNRIVVLELKENTEYFYEATFYEKERLIAREYYTDRLLYTHHYVTASQNGWLYAKLKRTTFWNIDGKEAYQCLYEEKGEVYLFPKGECLSKQELIEKFFVELNLTKKDVVVIDRPSNMNYVQYLLQYKNQASFIVFLHSGHYYKRGESPDGLFMNYEYNGWFKYSKYIDIVVVSTEEQKIDLEETYRMYGCYVPRVEVIPVSGLDEVKHSQEERMPYSLITVSRIDARKNILWLIESVIKAHDVIPNVFLDIYGTGNTEYIDSLKKYIADNNAESFIRFKGKMDVSELYKKYEAYISASLWETLGLSCMEAVGSGNVMVGLDVRYGNRLFIKDNFNGKLIEFNIDNINQADTRETTVEKIKEAIITIFNNRGILAEYHRNSYIIAEKFRSERIEKRWLELLEEFV